MMWVEREGATSTSSCMGGCIRKAQIKSLNCLSFFLFHFSRSHITKVLHSTDLRIASAESSALRLIVLWLQEVTENKDYNISHFAAEKVRKGKQMFSEQHCSHGEG